MIIFIFIATLIIFVDISGSDLKENLLPLIYIADVVEEGEDELGDTSSLSSEELAVKVKSKIFEGGKDGKTEVK